MCDPLTAAVVADSTREGGFNRRSIQSTRNTVKPRLPAHLRGRLPVQPPAPEAPRDETRRRDLGPSARQARLITAARRAPITSALIGVNESRLTTPTLLGRSFQL